VLPGDEALGGLSRHCGPLPWQGVHRLPADGSRGDILLAWKSFVVSLSNPHYSGNALNARVEGSDRQVGGSPGFMARSRMRTSAFSSRS
jgi:hypothetical protein